MLSRGALDRNTHRILAPCWYCKKPVCLKFGMRAGDAFSCVSYYIGLLATHSRAAEAEVAFASVLHALARVGRRGAAAVVDAQRCTGQSIACKASCTTAATAS